MSITPAEIAQLWRRVNREMRELARSTHEQHDLPPLAFPILHHIRLEPGITVSELARKSGAAKSHISNLADTLARDDYIEKRSDPDDQRLIRLYLKQAAIDLLEKHEENMQALWAQVFNAFPEQDLEDLGRFLRNLLEAFERANAAYRSELTASETIGVKDGK